MHENIIIWIAVIMMLGISAQWLAWIIRVPSILVLLIFGIIVGPLTGVINPDVIFGDILFPIVSLSVAIILFEGGLSLRLDDLRGQGGVVNRLVLTGTLVSWLLGAVAAYYVLGFSLSMALLIGAILVVTGPTVIIPLLRQTRPREKVACVLRWEAIVTDPMGAIFAVLVYEAIVGGRFHELHGVAALGIVKTILAGGGCGLAAGYILITLLRRYLVPDFMQNPVTLLMVLGAFTVSNLIQSESGLLAVTLMGAFIANRGGINISHIVEFKENLRVLLISVLFIVLAARLKIEGISPFTLSSLVFTGVLIAVVRPAAVLVSTLGTGLKWSERAFIALVAPRGIVAAAVASVFSLRLVDAGVEEGALLLPAVFTVIIVTVIFYGLGAGIFARILRVAKAKPRGFLIIGASSWALDIAEALKDMGIKTVLVDTNRGSVVAAQMRGLQAYYGSGVSEAVLREVDMDGIGGLLAMTPNNETNALAMLHFKHIFSSSELYQLAPDKDTAKAARKIISSRLHGRYLFGAGCDYWSLSRMFARGAVVKKTKLTEEFGMYSFLEKFPSAIPLFLVSETGELSVFTEEARPQSGPGHTLISIVEAAGQAQKPKTPSVGLDY
ncbi:MAG: cation:proton antiporter [Thermodesulfobacteriota bacterium]